MHFFLIFGQPQLGNFLFTIHTKAAAMTRIKQRRLRDSAGANFLPGADITDNDGRKFEIPDALPASMAGLREEAPKVNEHVYSIMEWWRRNTSADLAGVPRFEAFPAWGRLLRKIALCCPSSAAAERVFSLLKLVLNDMTQSQLPDKVEASMLLQVNDIDL